MTTYQTITLKPPIIKMVHDNVHASLWNKKVHSVKCNVKNIFHLFCLYIFWIFNSLNVSPIKLFVKNRFYRCRLFFISNFAKVVEPHFFNLKNNLTPPQKKAFAAMKNFALKVKSVPTTFEWQDMDRYDKKTRRERQNVHPRISDHCVHDHYAQLIYIHIWI